MIVTNQMVAAVTLQSSLEKEGEKAMTRVMTGVGRQLMTPQRTLVSLFGGV